MMVPNFTHDELRVLWDAISQYIENIDEDKVPPTGAESAQAKLDSFFVRLYATDATKAPR